MHSRSVDRIRSQRGFTLIELLAVMAILGILAGVLAATVSGMGERGRQAQFTSDANVIRDGADRFYTEAFPEAYPVAYPPDLAVSGIGGVGVIDFDARLPGEPSQVFVDDFLKDIPDSAALVSWRIDETSGNVFYADQSAKLVRPSTSRLNVSATSDPEWTPTLVSVTSTYDFELTMRKSEAAITVLTIEIPAGYGFDGNPASAMTPPELIGTLTGSFDTDNPWTPGQVIPFTGDLMTTGEANTWKLVMTYPTEVTEASTNPRPNPDHDVTIVPPSSSSPGQIEIAFNRSGEPTGVEHNLATENWTLTIGIGGEGGYGIITNPSTAAVYRWLAAESTTSDIEGTFDDVAGNQAVIIEDAS